MEWIGFDLRKKISRLYWRAKKNCYAMFSVESRRQDKARLSLHYNLIIVKSTVTVLIKIAAFSSRRCLAAGKVINL